MRNFTYITAFSDLAEKVAAFSQLISFQICYWDWTHLGTPDKTWPLAISGHPSPFAYPRIINSYALEQKTKGSGALTPTLGVLSMLPNSVTLPLAMNN